MAMKGALDENMQILAKMIEKLKGGSEQTKQDLQEPSTQLQPDEWNVKLLKLPDFDTQQYQNVEVVDRKKNNNATTTCNHSTNYSAVSNNQITSPAEKVQNPATTPLWQQTKLHQSLQRPDVRSTSCNQSIDHKGCKLRKQPVQEISRPDHDGSRRISTESSTLDGHVMVNNETEQSSREICHDECIQRIVDDHPDVLLDIPNASVDEISSLKGNKLVANASLDAKVGNRVGLKTGVDASIGQVKLTNVKNARASVLLVVRLDNVRAIVEKSLPSWMKDENTQLQGEAGGVVDDEPNADAEKPLTEGATVEQVVGNYPVANTGAEKQTPPLLSKDVPQTETCG